MQHDIPWPNPFITAWLRGPECWAIMYAEARRAQTLYRSLVAKRSGELGASATVDVHFGGVLNDRFIGEMIVTAPYASSEEFGAGFHGKSTGLHHQSPAHTLNDVLRLMAAS